MKYNKIIQEFKISCLLISMFGIDNKYLTISMLSFLVALINASEIELKKNN